VIEDKALLTCGDALEPPIGIEPMTYFITRDLPTRKALNWPATPLSTKATQLGQDDRNEVMYAQNTPTGSTRSSSQRG
jgi:hypothetical protein